MTATFRSIPGGAWVRSQLARVNRRVMLVYIKQRSRNPNDATLVKIGAHDGVTTDPVAHLIRSGTQWTGILVEPVPYLAERLRTNYGESGRFKVVEAVISGRAGPTVFHYVHESAAQLSDLPLWWDQVASLSRDHLINYLGEGIEDFIVSTEVRSLSLRELLRENGISSLALLHVDTEGADADIILSFPFEEVVVDSILYETQHLDHAEVRRVRRLLRQHGMRVFPLDKDDFAFRSSTLLSGFQVRR